MTRILRRSRSLATWVLLASLVALVTVLTPDDQAQAQTSVPDAPTGFGTSEIAYDRVVLVWDDPGDSSITGYQVLRRSVDGDEYGDGQGAPEFVPVVEDTGTPANTYTDTSVTPHTRYVYRVKAWNSVGLSWQSPYLNVETPELELPLAPSGLEATRVNHYEVTISWNPSGDRSVSGYQVLRRSVDGDEYGDGNGSGQFLPLVEDTGSTAAAYTDSSVAGHTRYVYRVRARNATGLSNPSRNLEVETPESTPPAAPTGVEAPEISHDRVTLVWDDPGDGSITGYQVLRRAIDGDEYGDGEGAAEFVSVAEDTGTQEITYTDTSVEPRTRYAYRVKARNMEGDSAESAAVHVNTPLEGPVWAATLRVGDLGQRSGSAESYLGYSFFLDPDTLSPYWFEYEGRGIAVYTLAFSETAQNLALMTNSPLDPALWLEIGGSEYAISGARVTQGPGEGHTIYDWDGVDLGWAVDDVVDVGLVLGVDTSRPNVIIILADDLGWGDLRTNNPDSAMTTPLMDSIAAAGLNFTDAHSAASACTGARYGLLTGRYPWRTWMSAGVLNGYDRPLIARDRPTLGTLFQEHGYRTAAVGKWHLGMDFTRLTDIDQVNAINHGIDFDGEILDGPTDHGFDEFFGVSGNHTWIPNVYIRNDRFAANPDRDSRTDPNFTHRWDLVQDRLTGEAASFIERSAESGDPFFLYFPLTAPHTPLLPAGRFWGATELGSYGDFVAQVDWTVGQVLDTLKRVGEYDNTLVILTSDNGSDMNRLPNHVSFDHVDSSHIRAYRVGTHQSNGPWRDDKGSIYEAGHRVPFMLQWPAALEAGPTLDDTISQSDLYATFAELLGSEPGPGVAPDSVSLLPLLRGETWDRGTPVVHFAASGGSRVFAIRDGKWKLVLDGYDKLFDLEDDPREDDSLARQRREVVDRLRAELAEIRASEDGTLSSDATLKQLIIPGIDIGPFDPDVLDYSAIVSRNVRSVEVMAIPSAMDARARVETVGGTLLYGKPLRGRVEVQLAGTVTTITVRVTSPDESATNHYTVRLARPGAPLITGTPRVGDTLAVDTLPITDPDGIDDATFSYQWTANDGTTDADIAEATASTYILAKADEGKTIKVRVSFTDDAGNPETRTSAPTAAVGPRPNSPATGRPAISGVFEVGQALTADTTPVADGNGMENAVYAYQWVRIGDGSETEIAGATGSDYTVTGDDEDHSLKVSVSFTDDDGYAESVASDPVSTPPEASLTGAFDSSTAPDSHDGRNTFEVQVYFSEEPTVGYSSLRDHVFTVRNGSVWGARRHDPDSDTPNIRWVIVVEPGGDAAVTIVLPPTGDCDDAGAVCTAGGKMLSNRSSITVPGPGQQGQQGEQDQEKDEPPAAPTGLTGALNGDGSITLTWTAPDGEVTGYQILRRRPEQGEATLSVYVDDTGSAKTTFTDSDVTGEGHFVYRVKARNPAGLSPWSNFARIDR